MKGYYFIENTVDEYSSREQGSFETLDEAIKALALLLLLMVPCFIGIAIDCIPLVLLGILFFAAAAVSILKYRIEHNVKDE